MPNPVIIVHGGAGSIQPHIWQEFCAGTHAAALAGQQVLDAGGTALDAAIAAVRCMEDDIAFNAGTGSALNRMGDVECDALVMTDDRHCGAVAGVSGVLNPIELARFVLEQTPHVLIVGTGAVQLARLSGLQMCDPSSMIVERRLARYQQMIQTKADFEFDPEKDATDDVIPDSVSDTVGACALDSRGHLAVASSTGGMALKLPGRAGDTPIIGGGSYCGPAGAVTCTGHGEAAMRVCLAKYAYDLLDQGLSAQDAVARAVRHLVDTIDGRAGLILMDRGGNRAWATSTRRISVGVPESMPEENKGFLPAEAEP
jgi:beta-aspartyl-peptidase (threonine type)